MLYPKIPLAQSVIELCKQYEIKHIVISPGSRNAPLTIGFTNNPYFDCYSVVDERCAGFFALGKAQQLRHPVALVCTSGSALLNYYPALAEAYYSQIPLVILSADRPLDKIDIGDGQTIRQTNVFANHSLYNANLTEMVSDENDRQINVALQKTIQEKGPVHINIPFEEPLYETTTDVLVHPLRIAESNAPVTTPSPDWDIWHKASRKLVLLGENFPDTFNEHTLQILRNDPSIVVFTETTSNVHDPSFVSGIDILITPFTESDFKALQPDLLLTVGGMVVSKRIKAFLRKYQPKQHWHIDCLRAYDTYGCLTQHFQQSVNSFFETLTTFTASTYKATITDIWKVRLQKHEVFAQQASFSDWTVFDFVLKQIPAQYMLQIANSSAIRYAQLFAMHTQARVFCNRGTSGIDGCTSTAIGAATEYPEPTVLITGDISFFYDSNALWNNYIPSHFKIILVNNSGGGIFRILPGHTEAPTFTTFFETHHNLTARHLCQTFGIDYYTADSIQSLSEQWADFWEPQHTPRLLEINTPEKINDRVLKAYFEYLKS